MGSLRTLMKNRKKEKLVEEPTIVNESENESIVEEPVIINEKNKHKYMFDYDYKENK